MDELDALLAELQVETDQVRRAIVEDELLEEAIAEVPCCDGDETETLEVQAVKLSPHVLKKVPSPPPSLDGLDGEVAGSDLGETLSPRSCGICTGCQEPIFSQKVMKLGTAWHGRCFRCTVCDCRLADAQFFEYKGKPYCEQDFMKVVAHRCAYCDGAIENSCITALGRTWHHDHFFCSQCGCAFPDGQFMEKDGKAYCEEDYYNMFAPRCGACSKPVMGTCVSALGKQWHPECFVCTTCKLAFTEQYYDHGGRPYCEVHFHAMQGTLCQTCQKPITGRCVTAAGNRRYHPEHFVCAFCKRQLMNTTYKETGAKFFCSPCHIKLFE